MEIILCSAIHYDDGMMYEDQPTMFGIVICGYRHSNCYATLIALKGEDAANKCTRDRQGFLTNENRYVSRSEAWLIAEKAGQIKYGYEEGNGENAILISENLYWTIL